MGSAKTSLFPLPNAQVVETIYVQLDDGRIVPRSPADLAALPPGQVPLVQIPSKP